MRNALPDLPAPPILDSFPVEFTHDPNTIAIPGCALLGAGPESIRPAVAMDFGLARKRSRSGMTRLKCSIHPQNAQAFGLNTAPFGLMRMPGRSRVHGSEAVSAGMAPGAAQIKSVSAIG
jgi:hypothetical protein